MNFNKDELVQMVYALGEGDRNCLLASRIYRQKKFFNPFSQTFLPDILMTTLQRTAKLFREFWSTQSRHYDFYLIFKQHYQLLRNWRAAMNLQTVYKRM
jgi:hypothetical protein